MVGRRKVVSVIGASRPSPEALAMAEAVGREVARRGYILACGGLGGVMEAACRGAKAEGGTTIGIIPGKDKADANRFVDIIIPTNIGYARNTMVVLAGDAVIAVAGGAGTLSELCYAWVFKKPVVAMTGVGGWSNEMAGSKLDGSRGDEILSASTPQEALDKLEPLLE
ncbi:MAG: TIGR00725 family protein [Promethearchaeota archaeon]